MMSRLSGGLGLGRETALAPSRDHEREGWLESISQKCYLVFRCCLNYHADERDSSTQSHLSAQDIRQSSENRQRIQFTREAPWY